MPSLEEIKNFIRIDFEEDDNLLLMTKEAAIETIKDMTGFDMTKSSSVKAKIVCLALINEMYKDRSLTTDAAANKIRPVYTGILIQLSCIAQKEGD